jgi:very-short-patch-repair endonuclease
MASALMNGDGHISHQAAAYLLRLDGFRELFGIDVAVPRTHGSDHRRLAVVANEERGAWRVTFHRPTSIDVIDRVIVDGIPCTAAARTLIDLAGPLRGEALEHAFESARRLGLVSVEHLAKRAHELCGRGRRGSREIKRLVRDATGTTRALESRLEVRAWRLWRSSTMPRPTRQHWVDLSDGSSARIDFALTHLLVGVEAEGFDIHGNRLRWKRDRRRVAMLEALGWRLVVVTWDDVTNHRAETIERIRSVIAERTMSNSV